MGNLGSKALFVQLVKTWFWDGGWGGVWECGSIPPNRDCTSTRGKAPHPPLRLRCATPDGPQPSPQRGEGMAKYGATTFNSKYGDTSLNLNTVTPHLI